MYNPDDDEITVEDEGWREARKQKERVHALCELIREAAPLAWAHGHSVANIEDAYAWEKKAKILLEEICK